MTQKKSPPLEHDEPIELTLRSRVLAAFAGVHLEQRPRPVEVKGRTQWVIKTAMTVRQLRKLYMESGLVHTALELHVDLASDIKQLK